MIKTNSILCPWYLGKLPEHNLIKDSLMDDINSSKVSEYRMKYKTISKTDWVEQGENRKYVNILQPFLTSYLEKLTLEMGSGNMNVYVIWFQQYGNGSAHDWHTHLQCQWTSVYYVDMPEGSPKTELIDPFTKKIIVVDAEEGDIITFPSFIIHRAPVINDNIVKTIISFNSCVDFTYDKEKHNFQY